MQVRKALIVGGGIGGLSAALHLERAGWEVSVVEQREGLSEVDTGLSLWAFASRRLAELGLEGPLAAIGRPMDRVVHRTRSDRQLSEVDVSRASERVGAPTYEVHRSRLQAMLAQALGDERIRFGRRCVGCAQNGRRPVARFADGTTEEADVVVGADGVHSAVREAVAGPVELRRAELGVWRGILEMAEDELPAGLHVRFVGPGGLVGVARINGTEVRWYAGASFRGAMPTSGEERKRLALEAFDRWPRAARSALERTSPGSYLFNDTPHAPPFKTWARDRIAVLGDAAHCSLPTLGISAGLAIEDGAVLADCLRSGGDPAVGLRAYERARRGVSARVVRTARLFGRIQMIRRRPAFAIYQLGVRTAPQSPGIRWLARGASGR